MEVLSKIIFRQNSFKFFSPNHKAISTKEQSAQFILPKKDINIVLKDIKESQNITHVKTWKYSVTQKHFWIYIENNGTESSGLSWDFLQSQKRLNAVKYSLYLFTVKDATLMHLWKF